MFKKIFSWGAANKKEALALLGVICLSAFFRLWRINEYLPFLGDEGRDVRVVHRFITDFDLMFIGPRTSIGDMYLGPLYYYYMAPWLALFGSSPTGPAVGVAILGILTVGLVWFVGREWFGKTAGIVAALLYGVSPLVINLSKHSWNPNIMPFFALLCVYGMWRVWEKREYKWIFAVGISFAFVVQSHYLGLLLLPVLGLLWLLSLYSVRKTQSLIRKLLVFSFLSFSLFWLLMSPLFLFDYKHGWHNIGAMTTFFTHRQETVSARPWNAIPNAWILWETKVIQEIIGVRKDFSFAVGIGIWVITGVVVWFRKKNFLKDGKSISPLAILLVWGAFGLLGLGSLKQSIYSHYFGFMFTMPFLLIGALAGELQKHKPKRWVISGSKGALIICIALIMFFSLQKNPLRVPPQRQMQRVQEIDRKIIKEAGGTPFNFGLVAERNYDEGYLYFFELWNAPVRLADPQHLELTVTDQLFVVCENLPCNPTTSPKAEIAHFGPSKIEKEWEIGGYKLYKLAHHQL
jgi:4-amino-4-deoxy-L-arabinose transferase-like glycosyltransferase